MGAFNATSVKTAFNKAVRAHAVNGGAATQLRPEIESIGPLRTSDDGDYRVVKYENGKEYWIDEAGIASIAYSYSLLVAGLTGNMSLVATPYWMEAVAPSSVSRAMATALRALPAGVSILVTLGMAAFQALVKSRKTRAAVHDLAEDVHEGTVAGFGREFCDEEKSA